MRRASAPWVGAALAFAGLVTHARAAAAQEERVLVLRAEAAPGHEADASPELLARAEGATIAALVSLSRTPLRDESAAAPDEAAIDALARSRDADWVLRVHVLPTRAGYVAQVEAIHPSSGTRRERSVEVVREQEVSQLVALLGPLLEAPEAPPPTVQAPSAPPEAQVPGAPGVEPPAGEGATSPGATTESNAAEQWRAREQARQEAASQDAWEGRERYGTPRMLLQGGLALRPVVSHPGTGGERVIGAYELRFGLAFPEVQGLEWRGSVEAVFGAISGLSLMTGAVYLFSPFVSTPVHIGPGLEIGWIQSLEAGARQAFFALRLSAVISWRFHGQWYLEEALPEITVLGGGGAAQATFGFAVRVGRRF
jgi:hypothetical protein